MVWYIQIRTGPLSPSLLAQCLWGLGIRHIHRPSLLWGQRRNLLATGKEELLSLLLLLLLLLLLMML